MILFQQFCQRRHLPIKKTFTILVIFCQYQKVQCSVSVIQCGKCKVALVFLTLNLASHKWVRSFIKIIHYFAHIKYIAFRIVINNSIILTSLFVKFRILNNFFFSMIIKFYSKVAMNNRPLYWKLRNQLNYVVFFVFF